MNRLTQARQLVRYFGPSWLIYRVTYAAQMRSGRLQNHMPAYAWTDRPLAAWLRRDVPSEPEAYTQWRIAHGGKFLFGVLPERAGSRKACEEAEAVLAGRWRYFERNDYSIGFPPDWHFNPLTAGHINADRHWTQISDFDVGDIKFIWEINRFGIAFQLVRAYAATRDERYAEAFWKLVEDWAANNPPQMGPNWKCGQETTFRLMAWCFGLYGFAASAHTTPARIALLACLIAAHAERIERNIAFARSQKNNHGISEGTGLWTVGLLFPEFERAATWREHGRRVVIEETRRQLYSDGAYIQHSSNYHRVMLHDCLWSLRLGELNDARLPDEVYERVSMTTDFLYQLLDLPSGGVPNYGANDGAHVLPLSDCDYCDFRPVLQAAYYLCHRRRLLPLGAWDEETTWLFGPEALHSPHDSIPQRSLLAETGGYYTLRSPSSWAMTRCATYHDRPSHADQLHVDLWWRGVNIACDAGTYLYNGDSPWDNRLSATHVHNTVTVDDRDQMTRAGRFLWLDWAQGRCLRHLTSRHLEYWEGEHDGYQRIGVRHRRGILRIGDESWLVLDALNGKLLHHFRLHWLLQDFPYRAERGWVHLQTPQGDHNVQVGSDMAGEYSLVRAGVDSTRGWVSHYYGDKSPALSLALQVSAQNCFFWSLFGPSACSVKLEQHGLSVNGQDWTLTAKRSKVIDTIRLMGALEDTLN